MWDAYGKERVVFSIFFLRVLSVPLLLKQSNRRVDHSTNGATDNLTREISLNLVLNLIQILIKLCRSIERLKIFLMMYRVHFYRETPAGYQNPNIVS